MPGFTTRLADGWHRAWAHLSLALVPIVLALFDTNKILAILQFDGGHIGFRLGLPISVVTIWLFVSVPNSGVAVNTGIPLDMLPIAIVTVPVLLVVQAVLTAGYFGSIRNVLNNEPYGFVASCRRYFIPFLIITVLPFLFLLPVALGVFGASVLTGGFGAVSIVLLLVALVGFLIAGYLFYATPYLIVLREEGIVDAARRSYGLAIQCRPYFAYAVGFALFALGVSPIATALVVNIPVLGLPIGIIGGGILGLTANLTTMRFVADIDSGSVIALSWENEVDEQAD
ncbi:hypothetical protein ACERIT_05185 [Halopenitus sp. H-Gu1]|uniref:hypothetical protein n=1 Tax=Halopenitus sp. H-Gu1 TaxID=3242697 RepID=UPI00359E6BFA